MKIKFTFFGFIFGIVVFITIYIVYSVFLFNQNLKNSFSEFNTIGLSIQGYYSHHNTYPESITQIADHYFDYGFYEYCVDPNRKSIIKVLYIFDDDKDSIVGAIIYSTGVFDGFKINDTLKYTYSSVKLLNLNWNGNYGLDDVLSNKGVVIQAWLPNIKLKSNLCTKWLHPNYNVLKEEINTW